MPSPITLAKDHVQRAHAVLMRTEGLDPELLELMELLVETLHSLEVSEVAAPTNVIPFTASAPTNRRRGDGARPYEKEVSPT